MVAWPIRLDLPMKQLTGFTIVELMITIALAAVILTLGVPAYQGLVERNRLTANVNSFISSLALARSEAVKRKQRVIICASIDGSTCSNNNSGYEAGWIVYVESIAPETNRSNAEELLWVSEPLAENFTLRATVPFNNRIQYLASGQTGGIGNASIFLCKDAATNKARLLTIIRSGRVHLAKNNANGVPLTSAGTEIPDCNIT